MPAILYVTPVQREAVEHAFGAMQDYWGVPCERDKVPTDDAEGVIGNDYTVPEGAKMPYLLGKTLVLSTWHEINDDLAYRVGEQYVDVLDDLVDCGEMTEQTAGRHATLLRAIGKEIRKQGCVPALEEVA